jgi:hypothetical protein
MKYLLFSLIFLSIGAFAQQISPESVNASGGKMAQANGSLSFTVGELVVLSFQDTQGNTLNGGFTASAAVTTVLVSEVDPALLSVSVYPNPTTGLVTVQISNAHTDEFILEVLDKMGKLILRQTHAGISSSIGINMASWPTGSYFLYVKSKDQAKLGTYQLIKL